LVRAVRSIQSKQEKWDPRYQLHSEAMIGLAEAGVINICACLPTLRPLFRCIAKATKEKLSYFSFSQSSGSGSRRIGGHGSRKDDASIILKDNPAGIARTIEWNVDSISEDGNRSRGEIYQGV